VALFHYQLLLIPYTFDTTADVIPAPNINTVPTIETMFNSENPVSPCPVVQPPAIRAPM
jgi:hypothetical protein